MYRYDLGHSARNKHGIRKVNHGYLMLSAPGRKNELLPHMVGGTHYCPRCVPQGDNNLMEILCLQAEHISVISGREYEILVFPVYLLQMVQ